MIGEYFRRKIRTELRAGGYTDLLLAGIDHTARGTDADTQVTGALEVSAGMWARALAAADVSGTEALTRRVRHRLARDLIRGGESVFEVSTENGTPALLPVAYWEVLKGWRYRLESTEPPGVTTSRVVARERVAHFQWSESPREPWRGIAPLAAASKLGVLAARVESKLAEDLATPTAHILPVPSDGGDPEARRAQGPTYREGGRWGRARAEGNLPRGWEETRAQAGTRNDWKAQTARTGRSLDGPQRDVERRAVGRRRCLWHPAGTLGPWGGRDRSDEKPTAVSSWRPFSPIADL